MGWEPADNKLHKEPASKCPGTECKARDNAPSLGKTHNQLFQIKYRCKGVVIRQVATPFIQLHCAICWMHFFPLVLKKI